MYCSKCGSLLKESDKFCPNCGAKVDVDRQTANKPQTESKKTIDIPEPTQKVENVKAKPKTSNERLVIVGFLVILAMFIPKIIKNEIDNIVGDDNPTSETVQNITHTFGDVVEFDEMEYVVKDYSFEDYMGGLKGLNKAPEGYCYIVLHVDVKNISDTEQSTQSANFKIIYDDKYEYNASFASYTEFYDYNYKIVALGSLEDKIINFEVPIELRDNSDKSIKLVLARNKIYDDTKTIWTVR